ncbi:alkaline phosphatase [Terribacillus saccharophilus]|uniref:TVP38/TMEM64 family membrane protein n=1 Tax=Terribacillus saccharophilus TaxID=361277 RepID=A0A268H9N8_9BACI|nr:VTT domain-containing protein [Terribacillus saccharophilus]PAE06592.1 alkaline phosphatase [Terribacillus saccharophilus]
MDQVGVSMLTVVATGGLFAPLLFVLLYLLRPALFLPVVFLCISGGILFGAVAGTILSIIGITASSMLFYGIAQRFPRSAKRILMLKQKLIGRHTSFTTGQVALMRLVPFIHFHILSVCLMENNRSWRSYGKASILSSIPLAAAYSFAGTWLRYLPPAAIAGVLVVLLVCIYLMRKKEFTIKWEEFFKESA